MTKLRIGKHEITIPAVCGSIRGKNPEEVRKLLSAALKLEADLVELRLDFIKNHGAIKDLIPADFPTLVTNRPKREGGHFMGSEDDRIRILIDWMKLGADCVDIELSTEMNLLNDVVKEAKQLGVSVLVSHHDFNGTPSVQELMEIAKKAERTGGNLIKIVTTANGVKDSVRIMDFLLQAQAQLKVPLVALAMGEAGKVSRIVSPLLGSPIIYAAVEEATAAGQMDIPTTKRLLTELGVTR
jgi:3-dehydroquinate dehydratase-1